MNKKTLILKNQEGVIERFEGKEAAEITKKITGMSSMIIEAMFGGIPLTTPEGRWVIHQSEYPEFTRDFIEGK